MYKLVAGSHHTCIQDGTNGQLKCWGTNGNGETGQGVAGNPLVFASPPANYISFARSEQLATPLVPPAGAFFAPPVPIDPFDLDFIVNTTGTTLPAAANGKYTSRCPAGRTG